MGALLAIDVNRTSSPAETDDRVREATLACIARFGLTKTTLDDIARESGVSRATIYRTFPGGREVLLQSVVAAEINRFFAELDERLTPLDDLEELLTVGLAASMRFLAEHAALRTIVQVEPGLLLPMFAFHRLDVALSHVAAFAAPHLEPHLGSSDAAWSAAEHLTRIVLTYTMHPDPAVDPSDDASIRRLVRHLVLPGLTAGTANRTITEPKGNR